MKILITGSSGFLGLHLIHHFAQNHEIFVISKKKNSSFKNVGSNILTVKKIPSEIDCIINLAAVTDVKLCQQYPQKCYETNVMGMLNMLELARKNDCSFIVPTSSLIFGKPKKLPLNENSAVDPITIHGSSKAVCESICKTYSALYGMNIITPRLFSIYGPQSPPYSIIYKIISQLLMNKKIILGNIGTKRDFLYVSDFVNAVDLLLYSNLKGYHKFNVGSGKSYSIISICKKLLKISGKSTPVVLDPSLQRPNDAKNLFSDSSKLQKLGWKPKISIDVGLKETFEWFKTS